MSVEPPWRAEYELKAEQVREVVSQNTDLVVTDVSFLGAGWDFYNWLVNKSWVFRFPKRHSDIDTLVHEYRILNRLDLPVETPRFEYWIDRPNNFHKPLAGYAYLSGSPLLGYERDACDLTAIGKTIGEVLTVLHQQSLTRPLVPVDPLSLWREGFDEIVAKAQPDLDHEIEQQVRIAISSYRMRERTKHQVTTHNDLGVEHILMHDHAKVSGLIDWADTATANGFVDFAGIWAWGGDRALAATIDHYFVEPTREDFAQIRVHGLCYALEQVAYGRSINDEELHTASKHWIQRRVRDGEIDDVYAKP